jgi:cellulose synthase/poly-beta-1,6-N-acetylglucosamine synthase-like glycosyltransferase
MNILLILFYVVTFIILAVGTLMLVYYPLAIIAELRAHRPPVFDTPSPLVSIIIPAYNEEKVIANCVKSILNSNYKNFEIILVDDGSTDRTLQVMRRYKNPPRVQVMTQPNSGKAAALNTGFQRAKGEILFFVDADGIFTHSTIREMLNAFNSEKVGAVCGNDAPTNLNHLQTKLMALQTHVGTGFVRRALAEINCLPIVSGNCGAFRRSALKWPFVQLGKEGEPYKKGFIGEDLELTWRLHRAGYRVNFAPRAIVLAEVPSTLKALWKQRVRWARGLLQTVSLHRDMFFNLKYGAIGLYLPINFFNMVVIPILQLLIIFLVILCAMAGYNPVQLRILNLILWLGLVGALYNVIFAVALDEAWKDLKYFYVLPLWVPFSLMMDLVTIWAIILELRGKEAKWNKFDRTGVISRRSMSGDKPIKRKS